MIFGLWLVVIAIGTVHPGWRLWGFHFPAYFSSWVLFVIIVLGAAIACVPQSLFERFSQSLRRFAASGWFWPVVYAVLVGCFYLFRARHAFLGDGFIRGQETIGGAIRVTEPLVGYLSSGIYRLAASIHPVSGQEAIGVLSILAGALFLIALYWLARRIWDDTARQIRVLLIILSSAGTCLFFGYIESYALPYLGCLGFVVSALGFLRGRVSFVVCALFFVVAIASHVTTALYFPLLVYLALVKPAHRAWRVIAVGVIVLAVPVWSWFIAAGDFYRSELTAGSKLIALLPDSSYWLFSPDHLIDLLNLVVLVCPGVLFALSISRASRTHIPEIPRLFWPLAIIPPLAIPLLLDPKLGMARDWDLFTIGLIPVIVWLATVFAENNLQQTARTFWLAIFTAGSTTVLFVAVNASTDASVARFKHLLELDQSRSGYGYDVLARHYLDEGDPRSVIEHLEKALQATENSRFWVGISEAYSHLGMLDSALYAGRVAYRLDSTYISAAVMLATVFEQLSMPDSAGVYYARIVPQDPQNAELRYRYARSLFRSSEYGAAEGEINVTRSLAPTNSQYMALHGAILIELGRLAEARQILMRGIKLTPGYLPLHLNMIRLYHRDGQLETAIAIADDLLKSPRLSADQRRQLQQIKNSLLKESHQ